MKGFLHSQLILSSLLVLALSLASCAGSSSAAPQVGKAAPDFTLPLLDGRYISLSELRGKPVLINFWATWCPACRAEMPHLQAAYEEMKDSGLVLLSVDIGEDDVTVRQFMLRGGYTFPVPMDSKGEVSKTYQVQAIPTTFLVDREGIIRGIKVGAFRDKEEILAQLRAIMPPKEQSPGG